MADTKITMEVTEDGLTIAIHNGDKKAQWEYMRTDAGCKTTETVDQIARKIQSVLGYPEIKCAHRVFDSVSDSIDTLDLLREAWEIENL